MLIRAFLLMFAVACVINLPASITGAPAQPAQSTGVLTCKQIVEQCDTTCQDPFCVRNCTSQGTPEGAQQHAAVVDCAQRSGCTTLDCIRASCPAESNACENAPQPPPPAAAAASSSQPAAY